MCFLFKKYLDRWDNTKILYQIKNEYGIIQFTSYNYKDIERYLKNVHE